MARDPGIYYPYPLARVTEWAGSDRGGGVLHYGTDFGVPQGSIVYATITGTVVWTGDDGLGAWCIDIQRADGLIVRHGHLSRIDVQAGQTIHYWTPVALSGGTPGTPGAGQSTGPHLHWEVRWDRAWSGGAWVDPRTLTPGTLTPPSSSTPAAVPV